MCSQFDYQMSSFLLSMFLLQDGFCKANTTGCGASISNFVVVRSGAEDDLMNAVATKGPISIAIDASLRTFSFYSNGVYYDKNCGKCVLHITMYNTAHQCTPAYCTPNTMYNTAHQYVYPRLWRTQRIHG